MTEDITYEEYLRRVAEQRQRDADRFMGVDQHLDQPIYDPATGKLLNPVLPRLIIELDGEGLPVIVACDFNNEEELSALMRAADYQRLYAMHPREIFEPRARAIEWKRMQAKQEHERQLYIDAHPVVCELCGGRRRFKTQRGLDVHLRSHKGRQAVRP